MQLACLLSEWNRADRLSLISLLVALTTIVVAAVTLHRGNLNTSAGTLIPLHAEIRDRWDEYLAAFTPPSALLEHGTPAQWADFDQLIQAKLERLLNVLEIAAAMQVEGTLAGVSRSLADDYVRRLLDTLIADNVTNERVSALLQNEHTYENIRTFLGRTHSMTSLLPKHWYETTKPSALTQLRRFLKL